MSTLFYVVLCVGLVLFILTLLFVVFKFAFGNESFMSDNSVPCVCFMALLLVE